MEQVATPSLDLIRAIADLGSFGLVLLFVWFNWRGEILWKREKAELEEYYGERINEFKERLEREVKRSEEWKGYALKSTLGLVQVGRAAVEREDEKTG